MTTNRQSRLMVKIAAAPLGAFLLCQCTADRPVTMASSQFAASATGATTTAPSKVKAGYDRVEFVHLPSGTAESGVLGTFDSEFRGLGGGAAVSEILITGRAALLEGPQTDQFAQGKTSRGRRLVSSATKTDLSLDFASSDGVSPSVNFGFRRAIVALFPRQSATESASSSLHSTYADVSVHASGVTGTQLAPNGISTNRRLEEESIGARVVQRIATGRAAEHLAADPKTKEFVKKQFRQGGEQDEP